MSSVLDFQEIKKAVQKKFNAMKNQPLYRVRLDKDKLWETYLLAFPEGTNPMFRSKTEHDCSCCRSFVKSIGDMVTITNGKLESLWDCDAGGYQPVVDAMAAYVRSHPIDNVYLHPEPVIGTDKTFESLMLDNGQVRTWGHFTVSLPKTLVCKAADIGPKRSEMQACHDVLLRSLTEISDEAVETVLDLISQNSLYRGTEKQPLVQRFAELKKAFNKLKNDTQRDLFAWQSLSDGNYFVSKIRNDVIGTLLVDLSDGRDLESAVKSFEDKVSGTNYKRPTALITPKMRDAAKAKLSELGLIPALERRFAVMEDERIGFLFHSEKFCGMSSGWVFYPHLEGCVLRRNKAMFDKATRMKLRFDTNVGRLSVEDLWDLPLTSTNSKTPNLDDLAIQLDQQVSETQRTSFVKKSAQNRSNTEARLKLDVVLHIIQVRVAEAEAAETRKQNADKKQKLMELIEQKQDETLKSKSVEELQALVSSL